MDDIPGITETTIQNPQAGKIQSKTFLDLSCIFPKIFTYLSNTDRSSTLKVLAKRVSSSPANLSTTENAATKNLTDTGPAHALMKETKELEKAEIVQEIKDLTPYQTPEQNLLLDSFQKAKNKSEQRELIIQFYLGLSDGQAREASSSITYPEIAQALEISQALEIRKAFLIDDPIARKSALISIAEKTEGSNLLLQSASYFYKQEDFQKNLEILQVVHRESKNVDILTSLGMFEKAKQSTFDNESSIKIAEFLHREDYRGALDYNDTLLGEGPRRDSLVLAISALDTGNYTTLFAQDSLPVSEAIKITFLGLLVSNNIPEIRKLLSGFSIEVRRVCLRWIIKMERTDLALDVLTTIGGDYQGEGKLCLRLIQLGAKDAIALAQKIALTIDGDSYIPGLCEGLLRLRTPETIALAKKIALTINKDRYKPDLCVGLMRFGTPDIVVLAKEIARTIDNEFCKAELCVGLFRLGTDEAIEFAKEIALTIKDDTWKTALCQDLIELKNQEAIALAHQIAPTINDSFRKATLYLSLIESRAEEAPALALKISPTISLMSLVGHPDFSIRSVLRMAQRVTEMPIEGFSDLYGNPQNPRS